MHFKISYNQRMHLHNLLTIVIGGSGAGKTRFFAKVNLMMCNTSFVVLDPKGELRAAVGHESVQINTAQRQSGTRPVLGYGGTNAAACPHLSAEI